MNVAKGDRRTPLGSSEASVKGALQRARATLEARLPTGREHAPPPGSPRERQLVGASRPPSRPATSTPCSTCLPVTRGSPCHQNHTNTRAGQRSPGSCTTGPACAALPCAWHPPEPTPSPPSAATGPCPQAPIARPYGMIVLTLED